MLGTAPGQGTGLLPAGLPAVKLLDCTEDLNLCRKHGSRCLVSPVVGAAEHRRNWSPASLAHLPAEMLVSLMSCMQFFVLLAVQYARSATCAWCRGKTAVQWAFAMGSLQMECHKRQHQRLCHRPGSCHSVAQALTDTSQPLTQSPGAD